MSPMITYDSWDPNIREAANSSYKGGACEHLVEDVYIYRAACFIPSSALNMDHFRPR